ncbi:MAG: hypothetical protein VX112_03880 [Pseudomonadota bacterium]|nr:hypothetical protein [Pseudomonadota bacterium]
MENQRKESKDNLDKNQLSYPITILFYPDTNSYDIKTCTSKHTTTYLIIPKLEDTPLASLKIASQLRYFSTRFQARDAQLEKPWEHFDTLYPIFWKIVENFLNLNITEENHTSLTELLNTLPNPRIEDVKKKLDIIYNALTCALQKYHFRSGTFDYESYSDDSDDEPLEQEKWEDYIPFKQKITMPTDLFHTIDKQLSHTYEWLSDIENINLCQKATSSKDIDLILDKSPLQTCLYTISNHALLAGSIDHTQDEENVIEQINTAIIASDMHSAEEILKKNPILIGSYRGLHFKASEIGKATRKTMRHQSSKQKAYYADAVLQSIAPADSPSLMIQNTQNHKYELQESAEKIKEALQELNNSGSVLAISHRFKDKPYLYKSVLHYVLEAYTLSKQSIVKTFTQLKKANSLPLDLSFDNPFLSCSQRVRHAWRYAAGLKEKEKHDALQPMYEKNGKPHYPHMGKIIIALIPFTKHTSHYADIGNMARHGQLALKEEHIVEQENCFFAYMPSSSTEPTVRFPNFSLNWKPYFEYKYGLKETTYNTLQKIFNLLQPQNPLTYYFHKLIAEILCLTMEPKIQALAQQVARKQNSTLAFIHENGLLSSKPPTARLFIKGEKNKIERNRIHSLYETRLSLAQDILGSRCISTEQPFIKVKTEEIATQVDKLEKTLKMKEDSNQKENEHDSHEYNKTLETIKQQLL